jgi:3-deoxy-7-phosphoheptulonate synthase
MNYSILKKLPSAEELIQLLPLSIEGHQHIQTDRQEIKNILEGKDHRLLMIIGPCSAWPKEAVLEYARRLSELNNQIKHAIKIVMRVYIQKPRTVKGWTGPINQPYIFESPNIETGMQYTREMMVKVIEMGLPISDEALFTHNSRGFQELQSWIAIGARSTEDQEHRIFASMSDCPVGMKNPTHGNLEIAVNSVIAAQHAHVFALEGHEIQTYGNPYAHLVLRGANHQPNYSIDHLNQVNSLMDKHTISNPSVIIDVSHDNCMFNGKKDYTLQPAIILETLKQLKQHSSLKKLVKGFMCESFIKEGHQSISQPILDLSGLSVTDPCLGWEKTEQLLLEVTHLQEQCLP